MTSSFPNNDDFSVTLLTDPRSAANALKTLSKFFNIAQLMKDANVDLKGFVTLVGAHPDALTSMLLSVTTPPKSLNVSAKDITVVFENWGELIQNHIKSSVHWKIEQGMIGNKHYPYFDSLEGACKEVGKWWAKEITTLYNEGNGQQGWFETFWMRANSNRYCTTMHLPAIVPTKEEPQAVELITLLVEGSIRVERHHLSRSNAKIEFSLSVRFAGLDLHLDLIPHPIVDFAKKVKVIWQQRAAPTNAPPLGAANS